MVLLRIGVDSGVVPYLNHSRSHLVPMLLVVQSFESRAKVGYKSEDLHLLACEVTDTVCLKEFFLFFLFIFWTKEGELIASACRIGDILSIVAV